MWHSLLPMSEADNKTDKAQQTCSGKSHVASKYHRNHEFSFTPK